MSDWFLPENYSEPQGNEFKITAKPQRIRILSSSITPCYIDWYEEKNDRGEVKKRKLVTRKQMPPKGKENVKFARWLIIWNYGEGKMQYWEVTQKPIREAITSLIDDGRGSPSDYDLSVKRIGEGILTKYSLTTTPEWKTDLDPDIYTEYLNAKVDMEAIFDWKNPLEAESMF